jgi:hypothetical protein
MRNFRADLAKLMRLLPWAVAFAIAHTLAPLYFSNQNQYLLHGAAEAGVGLLGEDWLANTQDPTPTFSALVAFTYRYLGENFLHVEYFVLLLIYYCSLAAVPDLLPGPPLTRLARCAYGTFVIVIHAAILRVWSVRLFGVDYPWYFQSGVAGQYILGPSLQPSAFGVLLVTSVVAFASGRPYLAAACTAVAAIMHPTYLLTAGLLTATYLVLLARAGQWKAGLIVGAGSLAAVLPVLVYSFTTFGPTTPDQFAQAQRILAEVRIPHHAHVQQWLDGIAVSQLVWIGWALLFSRRTVLFWLLLVPALAGLVLTLVQVVTGSQTLALLFPWRVSAVLVPLATGVILAKACRTWAAPFRGGSPEKTGHAVAWTLLGGLLLAAVLGGVEVMWSGLGYLGDEGELPLTAFVRAHKRPGEVYLLPVRIPKVGSAPRGAVSTTFRQPQRLAKDAKLIPVDLQRFRLLAEAPIYVDFKSVPYKDMEVLEWYRRLRLAEMWFESSGWASTDTRAAMAHEGVTHVVLTSNQKVPDDAGTIVYGDERYRILRLK